MPTSVNAPPALIESIDACLPQTQCTRCGYPRCRAYAEALAAGSAGINQCPPGGDATIRLLSALLRLPPAPLDPRFGRHQPRARAVIDEGICIGCRKCIDACPVDAIVGARKLMHTVVARECTGCELCLPPCPVDCIAMLPVLIEHARSASGSDHTNSPLPQSGRGVGEREPSPPSSPSVPAGVREHPAHPLDGTDVHRTSVTSPSRLPPGGKGASRSVLSHAPLYSETWPEYALAETTRWRRRTDARLKRLARDKQSRRKKAAGISGPAATLPDDKEKIRAEIRAAIERVNKKRKTGKPQAH